MGKQCFGKKFSKIGEAIHGHAPSPKKAILPFWGYSNFGEFFSKTPFALAPAF